MKTTETKKTKSSRKEYDCDYCGEKIEFNNSYVTWHTYGEATTSLHPECYQALLKIGVFENEFPETGKYKRGRCD